MYRVKKQCVCRYLLNPALKFAWSFLRIVILVGKLLKMFMPANNVFFLKQGKLPFGL